MHRLKKLRRLYAAAATAGIYSHAEGGRIRQAFAQVPRERFLGDGPWQILTPDGYRTTRSADPAEIYHDVLVALDGSRRINNGEPSLHARALAEAAVQHGEHVTHIGAGTGYYTALLARLTGPTGKVHAFEIEPSLAERARRNLRKYEHVQVEEAAGDDVRASDVIYVSAGVSQPLTQWLDVLRDGGRLVLPLTGEHAIGAMLQVKRLQGNTYQAHFFSPAMFIPCAIARDVPSAEALDRALAAGGSRDVRSLRRDNHADESCWLQGDDWWLSYTRVS